MGPSASGKSTFLKSVAGLIPDIYGYIALGTSVLLDSEKRINLKVHKRRVGLVFQEPALFNFMSVKDNLSYPLLRHRFSDRITTFSEVSDVLELESLFSKKVENLSGGEKQRLALGRTLLASPRLLLLDEPLSGLDEFSKKKIVSYINDLADRKKITMIYVTHSSKEAGWLKGDVVPVNRIIV